MACRKDVYSPIKAFNEAIKHQRNHQYLKAWFYYNLVLESKHFFIGNEINKYTSLKLECEQKLEEIIATNEIDINSKETKLKPAMKSILELFYDSWLIENKSKMKVKLMMESSNVINNTRIK